MPLRERVPADVRFAPKATHLPRGSEMTLCAAFRFLQYRAGSDFGHALNQKTGWDRLDIDQSLASAENFFTAGEKCDWRVDTEKVIANHHRGFARL